ncbi:MAG: MYXO-CTERM sorting domain-containing protein, partial [Myxococcota bacterium]
PTESLPVEGSVTASDGVVAATVTLSDDLGTVIDTRTLDQPIQDDVLASFDLQNFAPGFYEVTVSFDDGGRAVARRTIEVLAPPDGPPEDSGLPTGDTGSPGPEPETGRDTGTEPLPQPSSGEGCGCQSSAPTSTLLLLPLTLLLRQRRGGPTSLG